MLVEGNKQAILGLKTCMQLGLIKRVHVINKEVTTHEKTKDATSKGVMHCDWVKEYKEVFKGIGRLPGEYKIKLKEDAEPVIHPARKVPVALKERLREKLDTLIKEREEPTEWVKDLNKAIQREHYKLPTGSDITSAMSGACYFSKLDALSGFYQIVLDEESAKLCTFNTPFGRHCFLRLPFGISSAPEVFHKTVQ